MNTHELKVGDLVSINAQFFSVFDMYNFPEKSGIIVEIDKNDTSIPYLVKFKGVTHRGNTSSNTFWVSKDWCTLLTESQTSVTMSNALSDFEILL